MGQGAFRMVRMDPIDLHPKAQTWERQHILTPISSLGSGLSESHSPGMRWDDALRADWSGRLGTDRDAGYMCSSGLRTEVKEG